MGFGMPSATAEDAPRTNSSSEVTTILRMVLFMFFSCGGLGSVHGQKHSLCPPLTEDKIGIFQSSEVDGKVFGMNDLATQWCVRLLGKFGRDSRVPQRLKPEGFYQL